MTHSTTMHTGTYTGTLRARALGYATASGATLLHALSFDAAGGECLAIVGPNGAGKSTLLRLLAGRLPATQGTVSVDGRDVAALAPQDRARRIAVLAQSEPAGLALRVREYVALGRIPWRLRSTPAVHQGAVRHALALCGLESAADRALDTLSGGERQRAGLARALAQEPSVLLLDEPTNHLDLRGRCDLLDLVRGLGITVVAVLHELALVGRFADRVAVLERGRLVALGAPAAALSPSLVRDVFRVDTFSAPHPRDGRPVLMFDSPMRNAAKAAAYQAAA